MASSYSLGSRCESIKQSVRSLSQDVRIEMLTASAASYVKDNPVRAGCAEHQIDLALAYLDDIKGDLLGIKDAVAQARASRLAAAE
jgi:hypothetical protein